MLDVERRANELARLGQGYRRLMETDLPEFPDLNYCVTAGGRSIRVQINDASNSAGLVLRAVRAAQTAGGVLGSFHDDPRMGTLLRRIGSLAPSLIDTVRDGVLEYRQSGGNDPSLEFMRESREVAQGVQDIRTRMVCTVQRGVPRFYRETQALERQVGAMERAIRANPACPANGLVRLLQLKMRALRQVYRWHAEGILRPPGARTNTGYARRNTWLDRRVDHRHQPQVFNEITCR